MNIAAFIRAHDEALLTDWEEFARTLPAAEGLSREERRDAAAQMLEAIAADMEARRSGGDASSDRAAAVVEGTARKHAADRLLQHFTLEQMAAEYRALRGNVTRRWIERLHAVGTAELEELATFNAAVDDSMAVAIAWYNARLEKAQDELRASDRAKDEFLAILGHELRNPLAPLTTGLQLLRQANRKPDLLDQLRPMMERQLSHLLRLVDDLLDVSRINRGQLGLQAAPVDLHAAVDAAIEQVNPLMDARRHDLVVQPAGCPLPVVGDFERLTQVVANLLSNAAKYTRPEGTITLVSESEDGHALVRVEDTGFGIPASRFERIFELFSQVPEHRSLTGGGGLGVGLALSKQIVEMHGGSIQVASKGLGHGSAFIVRLPLRRAPEATRSSS